MKNKLILTQKIVLPILIIFSLIFSFWLMFHTFSYKNGGMQIAPRVWSDFSGNIPLIRSFSLGDNFPPEYPLFSGEPIRYHFLFYLFVGFLEKIGLNIAWALNIPSAIGFTLLLMMIYFFANFLFKNKLVATLAVFLFLFNGSLSFLEFFKIHPLNSNTINDILKNQTFPSFGPYDGKIISAFWNLNIYTNQRHLALAFGLSLSLLYFLLKQVKTNSVKMWVYISLGLLLGLSFFFHLAVFFMTVIILISFLILFPIIRIKLLVLIFFALIISLPQYLIYKNHSTLSVELFNPGYLVEKPLDFAKIIIYWFHNLGLHLLLIPLGFLLASKTAKKVLLSFLVIFVIGNLFQFSPEIAANHKFFNFFMILGVMYSSYFLICLWKKSMFSRPLVIILLLLSTLSGIIDFFPIYNDSKGTLKDYPTNSDIKWIMNNTPKNAVFLNSSYLYDPASMAGRRIFLGWPYFAWSQGYDTNRRGSIMKDILKTEDLQTSCKLLTENRIDYIEISEKSISDLDFPRVSNLYLNNHLTIYSNPDIKYFILKKTDICK
ncbi:MAG: hypothetical protein Q7R43_04725 [Candidatus Daviesbacteria bacterium]|nr:hypothetical protein [Candidatus Daviesbacteria bacterium]